MPNAGPNIQIQVEANAPAGVVTELRVRAETSVTAIPAGSINRQIQLFNYTTNLWEQVHSAAATSADSEVEVFVTSNPQRFIDPATRRMRMRLNFTVVGPLGGVNWQAKLDRADWRLRF